MRAHLEMLGEALAAVVLLGALLLAAHTIWQPVRVSGRSMCPALLPGDVVVVARAREPVVGDIVLLQMAGHGPILHRVVRVATDGRVTTRGDANAVADREAAPARAVKGVVVRVLPIGIVFQRWQAVGQVGYHDGSTAQCKAMTETTFATVLAGQGRARVY